MVNHKKLKQMDGFQLTDIRIHDIDRAVEIHIRRSRLRTVEFHQIRDITLDRRRVDNIEYTAAVSVAHHVIDHMTGKSGFRLRILFTTYNGIGTAAERRSADIGRFGRDGNALQRGTSVKGVIIKLSYAL